MPWHGKVCALALLVVCPVAAAVTITGSVVDETGIPIAGARVSVDTTTATTAATTDAAGVSASNFRRLVTIS